ncbi:cupin domain-containing protein [Brucella endophytica]|nr:cupin domain-containing protein [Brucella endophytica]
MTPETYLFEASDEIPNNSRLPVLYYRGGVKPQGDAASHIEALFLRNGWTGTWRNGVFSYHHYHTEGHEVLGVASGWARLLIGGRGGKEMKVQAGDIIILPAGTGHCSVEAGDDFLVVGAYPPGQRAEQDLAKIARLPLPSSDPLQGENGPLVTIWQRAVAPQT